MLLMTSHFPASISATKHPRNMTMSFQIVFSLTSFLIFPNVPSSLHRLSKYIENAITSIAPSGLLSCPSSASMNGSISAAHIVNLCFVNMFGSSLIFFPRIVTIPSANAACTMFVPMIVPNPTLVVPARNPESELIISGALAAIATTTSPIIASDSPSFFA